MDNEFSEKVHVGIRRERQKNGDIYVFENKTVYDPKSRKTKSVGQKLTGKMKAGTNEIVSTRSKRKKGETSSTTSASRLRTGLTDILNWAGKTSGIDADVFAAFSEGDAKSSHRRTAATTEKLPVLKVAISTNSYARK